MKIDVDDVFCLPPDVEMTDVEDLDEAQRTRLQAKPGQVAIRRRHARTSAKLITRSLADLLELFRAPQTIADAIEHYASDRQASWEDVLATAYPKLRYLIERGILVSASAPSAEKIVFGLAVGDEVDGLVVTRAMRLLEDTEIYLVRTPQGQEAVLKLLRPAARTEKRRHLRREAAILRRLPTHLGPALLREGAFEGRGYLLLEWIAGLSLSERAEHLRRRGPSGHRDLLACGIAILQAYKNLHAAGVLHADVHPQNILCGARGAVFLIDFGLGRIFRGPGKMRAPERGGVPYYMEPELAAAQLAGKTSPPASEAGEQYAIAALLYEALSGKHPIAFVLVRDQMLRQIAEEEPPPGAGDEPWPQVGSVLRRSLSKRPENRFASVAEMAAAFESAAAKDLLPKIVSGPAHEASEKLIAVVVDLAKVELDQENIRGRPIGSIMNGSAGIALGLHRIACAREDAELFAWSDAWAQRISGECVTEEAFTMEPELTRQIIGHVSPYHTMTGVHFAAALLAADRGDVATFHVEVERFSEAILGPCENLDLTLGLSGGLLAAAILLDAAPALSHLAKEKLKEKGNELAGRINAGIAGRSAIGEDTVISYSGIAHGWAGILYALFGWCRMTGEPLPAQLGERAEQLAACARPAANGVRWPRNLRTGTSGGFFPSWCNGNGGMIPFWLEAAAALRHRPYLDLALAVGENTWEEPSVIHQLCCGTAGQAYGLLALYQATHDAQWLDRARHFAWLARDEFLPREPSLGSLFKGKIGVVALLADLEQPEQAVMPCFGLSTPDAS